MNKLNNPKTTSQKEEDSILKLGLPAPKDCLETLHVPVGYSCNNNCIFCMENDRTARFRRLNALSDQDVERMLLEKKRLGKVIFTSGEPTLNPKLIEYIKLAKKKGYKTVAFVTNGRRLSYKPFCIALLRAGANEIIFSMHSTKKEIHEALTRTKGGFKQSWNGLINLSGLKQKYNFKIYVSLVLNKLNYNDIQADLGRFSKLNIDGVVLNTLQPLGRGDKKYLIPKYTEVIKKIKNLHETNIQFSVIDVPLCVAEGIEDRLGNLELYHIKEGGKYSHPSLRNKIKRHECNKCRYGHMCLGVWKNYIKYYGWEEFKPIATKKRAGRLYQEDNRHLFLLLDNCLCDCRCFFCSRGSDEHQLNLKNHLKEFDYKKEFSTIQEIIRRGYNTKNLRALEIGGNEPLNHPKIIEVVEFSKLIGYKKIILRTCGLRFSNLKFTRKMAKAGLTQVELPIYGSKKQIHDKIVGLDGAFDKLNRSINNLNRFYIDFRFHTTLLKQNLHDIHNFANNFNPRIDFPRPISYNPTDYKNLCVKISHIPKKIRSRIRFRVPCLGDFSETTGREQLKHSPETPDKPAKEPGADIRIKPSKCKSCVYCSSCEGFYKMYFKLYGEKEFRPITR
ncbi:radical SAM protein [Candidatus Woesearchaeota archaeon]|nr:radical SAM protein [Candidatus Woesearchaeota archaeon]